MHIEHVHEGKRYQCSDCGEVYDSLTKLDTHIGLAHDKTKLFECPTCKATYASAKTLNKHVAFVHNQNSGKDLFRNGRNINISPIFMVM